VVNEWVDSTKAGEIQAGRGGGHAGFAAMINGALIVARVVPVISVTLRRFEAC